MKIALLGYGKMGKSIEKIAIDREHDIILRIDKDDNDYDITLADVAIDFSTPDTAFDNITNCLRHQVPVICGTTGWLQRFEEATAICNQYQGKFIYASNFSLGVNLFFNLNEHLAKIMVPFKEYQTSMVEIHHTQKLDAPSGTAITLAEGVIANSKKEKWELDGNLSETNIPIVAKREENIPGTHTICYQSAIDNIEITHTAHNRLGFAQGAVIAAEWIVNKNGSGIFSIKDVLGL